MDKPAAQSRIWMIVSIVLFAILLIYVIVNPPGKSGDDVIVAKVNGVAISKERLYLALVESGGSQTLETMISEELINQEVDKAGITITDEDLNKEIDSIKSNFSSEEEFAQLLTYYNMTMDDLKEEMQIQAQLRKLLEPQVTVTDEDIKTYYDSNLESFEIPEQVRASHILVETMEEAEAILSELKSGSDFAAVAMEKSTDTGSKEAGGDLDFFSRGEMDEAFETAAFSMNVGDLSEVVESSFGFHIIKLTDHKDATTPTLEEKTEEIREKLVTDQITTLSSTWLEEKRTEATIETFLQ